MNRLDEIERLAFVQGDAVTLYAIRHVEDQVARAEADFVANVQAAVSSFYRKQKTPTQAIKAIAGLLNEYQKCAA